MRMYLNGYWDILPLFGRQVDKQSPSRIKPEEFVSERYIVPSMFCVLYNENDKGLFNSFDYPDEWNQTRDAWLHKEFHMCKDNQGKRVFLHFGAIVGHSYIWVNDNLVGANCDSSMPVDIDITDYVKFDDTNSIHVGVTDLSRTDQGDALFPAGGIMINHGAGIWQDVYLEIKEQAYISDYYYRTSYRNKRIDFGIELKGCPADHSSGLLRLSLRDRSGQQKKWKKNVTFKLGHVQEVCFEIDAQGLNFWSAENPYLYDLTIELVGKDNRLLNVVEKRVGFKEIWIDGPHFYINGKITHLYGDWGHRVHCYQQRPEYIRCWFGMLKDLGMNYVRLHTGPHDPIVYEVANEMGIYICGETALHGSGRGLAVGQQDFWKNAFEHAKRFVQRDRNEVCIVLWSACNEMRHNPPLELTVKELPKVAQVIKRLDPTRPVYCEGDSSLWDETKQAIISRHYGDVTGEGWWDKAQPLLVGEMVKWHYAQPPENVMLGGNKVYESLWDCHRVAGIEGAFLIERARINDVSGLFPWNLSCLDNPALPDQDVALTWDDLAGPHPKPARVCAFSSEFHWWDEQENRYNRGSSFDLIKSTLKPETVFIWEKQSEYFVNSPINRTVTVINDTECDCGYELSLSTYDTTGNLSKDQKHQLTLRAGSRKTYHLAFEAADTPGKMSFRAALTRGGMTIEEKTQEIDICERKSSSFARLKIPILNVFGDGSLNGYFRDRDLPVDRIESMDNLTTDHLLIIEKDSIREEDRFVDSLAAFVQQGGRLLLLEQSVSILKDMDIEHLGVIEAHPETTRLQDVKLSWWDEKAVLGRLRRGFVARYGYQKPNRGNFCSWVDVGTGDWGKGGLCWSALLEIRIGHGVLLANTLELTSCWARVPSAARVLDRTLGYLATYQPTPTTATWADGKIADNEILLERLAEQKDLPQADVLFLNGSTNDEHLLARATGHVEKGATALVLGITPETKQCYEGIIGDEISMVPIEDECQAVLSHRNALTEGISNEELFWYNRIVYTGHDNENHPISSGYAIQCDRMRNLISITPDRAFHEFIKNYSSEIYRSKMFPMFGGGKREGALLGEIAFGDGRFIMCQIRLPFIEEHRSIRFWAMLLNNLGIARDEGLLGLSASHLQQKPYPYALKVIKDYSPQDYLEITSMKRKVEKSWNTPELSIGYWEDLTSDSGTFALDDCDRAFCIMYIESSRPRQVLETLGGLPNPSHTTCLEIRSEGDTEVSINGKKVFDGVIGSGRTQVIPEVELEEGLNSVYIVLKQNLAGSITLMWKTASGKEEHELLFQFPSF